MTYPTHPNFTIQKIAREVTTKIDRGEDAYSALLAEAQRNNLTPEVLTSAVQYINNEIYLNHYKTASKGNPKIIKVEQVLESLNKKASVKTASIEDHNDLSFFTKNKTMQKTASVAGVVIENQVEDEDYTTKRLKKTKIANELKQQKILNKNAAYETNQLLTKTAIEISAAKNELLKVATLALTRNEVTPEEILVLSKTAEDLDVSEILSKALTKANKTPKNIEATKLAENFTKVNVNSEIIKWANLIVNGKDRLCEFNEKFNSIETADLRRLGMHKLMDASYGKLY